MFGKSKDDTADGDQNPAAQRFQRSSIANAASESPESVSSVSSGTTIVGKITSEGAVKIYGRVEGELRASSVSVADGAHVEGDIVAETLTIGGCVKGTIHANSVRLNGTAVVEGDIYHRSLAIEEHARFEGSSRREEAVIDKPSRTQPGLAQSQSQSAAGETTRKSNGPNGNGETRPFAE